ncbi:MAG: hypothetical protein HY904_02070 [Deltaproteobacteria bacterium]|nr:hypothetical protein [Deltaproteobacteria bacterium]
MTMKTALMDDTPLRVLGPEDLLVLKVRAGGAQDRVDARALMALPLDEDRVQAMATRAPDEEAGGLAALNVSALKVRAFRRAVTPPPPPALLWA